MVPKPSNPKELRLVIDYRQINEITVKDRYPLPDVQSLIDNLQGATIFSTGDALWGFWQVPMEEDAIDKTTMTTPFGAYEWLVMPMGLSNSPSCWQRMMQSYLGHLSCTRLLCEIQNLRQSWDLHEDEWNMKWRHAKPVRSGDFMGQSVP
eukprot:gene5366-biopygen5367